MLCYFQSECVFYFFKHTQYTQRYGKSYRTYTKNCFFGKFESKYVKSSYNSYVYNHYDDYDELSQRDGYRHYSTPPRPNTFNFEFSTFIQLTTKLTEENKKVNVTGSMINGLHLGPQKTNWYGKCQGAGIHVITNTTWDLDFKLVYKDNKPCFFKILRLVKGYMKLRIPNFAVRFSPKILHQLHYELDVFQAEKKDHLKISSGPKISEDEDTLVDFDGNKSAIDYDWTLNLVTLHWAPFPSKLERSWDIDGIFELIQEQPVE